MASDQRTEPGVVGGHQRERLLRTLAAATFIIFFQAYMVAPIMPALSNAFGTSVEDGRTYRSGISDPLRSCDPRIRPSGGSARHSPHHVRVPGSVCGAHRLDSDGAIR
jgi:hypothetical protein